MPELWKQIPQHPRYEASTHGRIRSWATNNPRARRSAPRVLQPLDGRYLRVKLAGKKYSVHRLVLLTFRGLPEPGEEGSHGNGNRHDNRLGNLAWETKKRNNQRKREHGTQCCGATTGTSKLTETQVLEIRQRYAVGGVLQRELGVRYGVDQRTISTIVTGVAWQHLKPQDALPGQ